jgi:hypothetical protein
VQGETGGEESEDDDGWVCTSCRTSMWTGRVAFFRVRAAWGGQTSSWSRLVARGDPRHFLKVSIYQISKKEKRCRKGEQSAQYSAWKRWLVEEKKQHVEGIV